MKHYPAKSNKAKIFSHLVAAAICLGLTIFGLSLLWLFYPVRITIFKTLAAGNREPFGSITTAHPLEFCFPLTQLVTQSGPDLNNANGASIDSIEFFTATYQRINTSTNTITFYSLLDGQKKPLGSQIFPSTVLPDNGYFTVDLPSPFWNNLTLNGHNGGGSFCFSWASDGNDLNSATVWLNEYHEPVLRLKRSLPFYRALDYIQRAKHEVAADPRKVTASLAE